MNCKICGKPVPGKPFVSCPPDIAWCSRKCWAVEGDQSKEKARSGKPLDWNVKNIQFGR